MPEEADRAEAIRSLAEAMEDTSNRVADLTEVLRRSREATHDELARIRRLTVYALGGLAVLLLLALIAGYSLFLLNDTISPAGSRFKSGQARTQQLVANLVYDGDCRHRRAMVGLPAPPLGTSCARATPAEIFPGTTTTLPPMPDPVTPPVTPVPDGTATHE